MKELIRPLSKHIRCEVYACKKMAGYSIGHPAVKSAQFHICEDCLRTVIEQAGALLHGDDWTPEHGKGYIPQEIGGHTDDPTLNAPFDDGESSDSLIQEEKSSVQATEPKGEEIAPTESTEPLERSGEVYTCRNCGETFKRPDEKMKYMGHVRACKQNPKNAGGGDAE